MLIAIGLFLGILLVSFIGGYTKNANASTALVVLIVVGTSLWAALDSARIRIREHKTALASHPVVLFIGMVLLWVVFFPWYLVVRSRIRAGWLERREHPRRLGLAMLWILVGVVVLPALVYATLLVKEARKINDIWEATKAEATKTADVVSTPQGAATPTGAAAPAMSPVSQEASEPVPFDSADALLKDNGQVRGKLISVKAKVSSIVADEIVFETGEAWFNWSVTCQSSTEQQTAFQNLKEGQELTITGTVPAEGTTQLRAPTPEQSGLYELKLSGCRIP